MMHGIAKGSQHGRCLPDGLLFVDANRAGGDHARLGSTGFDIHLDSIHEGAIEKARRIRVTSDGYQVLAAIIEERRTVELTVPVPKGDTLRSRQ